MRASSRARAAATAVLAAMLLGGCGLLGGTDRDGSEWALDEASGRYFRPGVLVQSPELVEEHFPVLEGVAAVTIAEGRFTDPSERVPIPAPDDHWWQAVIELEPAQVDELLSAPGTEVPEQEILAELVPTLEGEVRDCPGGWFDVTPALSRDSGGDISVAGDMLTLVVVCADGTQLLTSANDM